MKWLRHLSPYIGGLIIAALLVWFIDWRDVLQLLARLEPKWFLIGCAWYILTNLLRAFRFGVLLNNEKTGNQKTSNQKAIWAVQILPEMFVLSLLNNLLPSRTGELSFPYYMQRRHNVSFGEGATALAIARIFDLLSVITLYLLFAPFELRNLSEIASPVLGAVGLFGIFILVLLLAAPWIAHRGVRLLKTVLTWLRLGNASASKLLLNISTDVADSLNRMRSVTIYARTYAWSLGIWLATFAWFDAFLRAIEVPVRYTLVVIGATFASVAKALPFISIGGFGAHEAGWTVGFVLVGMERSQALSTGFAVNLLTVAVSLVCGGLCLILISIGVGKTVQSST